MDSRAEILLAMLACLDCGLFLKYLYVEFNSVKVIVDF